MPNEQLQELIIAVQALIETQRESNRLAEVRVVQSNDKTEGVALESLVVLLQKVIANSDNSLGEIKEAIAQAVIEMPGNESVVEAITNLTNVIRETESDKDDAEKMQALATIGDTLNQVLEHLKADKDDPNAVRKVEVINFPKEKEGPEDVKVINEVQIAKPKWYEAFSYTKITQAFKEMLGSLVFRVKHEEVVKVYIVDEKGKIISDFSPTIINKGGEKNGAGGGPSQVGLMQIDGKSINPATQEGQAAIIAAIEAMSPGGGSGVDPVGLKDTAGDPLNPATKENQELLITQTEQQTDTLEAELAEINTRLQQLFGAMGITDQNQRFRIVVDAGTITTVSAVTSVGTVTTVSTVANQTNMGGNPVAQVPINLSDIAIANAIRSQITTS